MIKCIRVANGYISADRVYIDAWSPEAGEKYASEKNLGHASAEIRANVMCITHDTGHVVLVRRWGDVRWQTWTRRSVSS